ncbi:HTH_Tnp_Tc3_2 domain-containing protein [Trichonephila clavipes]|nr:HTH_Tnp_Tc3_2 domain-containing protein [Trichonephila clavipes]
MNERADSSRQLAVRWSTATGVLISASSTSARELRAKVPLYRIPARQTFHGCVCNGLIGTEPCKLIGTKMSFQTNHAAICGTMMAAFVLDAMPVNGAVQNALSNDIVA